MWRPSNRKRWFSTHTSLFSDFQSRNWSSTSVTFIFSSCSCNIWRAHRWRELIHAWLWKKITWPTIEWPKILSTWAQKVYKSSRSLKLYFRQKKSKWLQTKKYLWIGSSNTTLDKNCKYKTMMNILKIQRKFESKNKKLILVIITNGLWNSFKIFFGR